MANQVIDPEFFTEVARSRAADVGRIGRLEEGTLDATAVETSITQYVFGTMGNKRGEYAWLRNFSKHPSPNAIIAHKFSQASQGQPPLKPIAMKDQLPWWENSSVLNDTGKSNGGLGLTPMDTKESKSVRTAAKFDSKRSPAPMSDYEMDLRRLQRGEIKYSSLRPPLDDTHLATQELRELDALVMDLQDLDKRPVSAARNAIRAKKLAALTMLQTPKSSNTRKKA